MTDDKEFAERMNELKDFLLKDDKRARDFFVEMAKKWDEINELDLTQVKSEFEGDAVNGNPQAVNPVKIGETKSPSFFQRIRRFWRLRREGLRSNSD